MTAAVPAADVPVDTVTEPEDSKTSAAAAVKEKAAAVLTRAGGWRGFVTHPMPVKEAWERSWIIDRRRIPADSSWWYWWWYWSNRTDRILLFGVLMILPTALNKPVLYAAQRPTRRWGMYLVVFCLLVILPAATAVA